MRWRPGRSREMLLWDKWQIQGLFSFTFTFHIFVRERCTKIIQVIRPFSFFFYISTMRTRRSFPIFSRGIPLRTHQRQVFIRWSSKGEKLAADLWINLVLTSGRLSLLRHINKPVSEIRVHSWPWEQPLSKSKFYKDFHSMAVETTMEQCPAPKLMSGSWFSAPTLGQDLKMLNPTVSYNATKKIFFIRHSFQISQCKSPSACPDLSKASAPVLNPINLLSPKSEGGGGDWEGLDETTPGVRLRLDWFPVLKPSMLQNEGEMWTQRSWAKGHAANECYCNIVGIITEYLCCLCSW